jgi:hypothetical protein
LVAQGVVGWVVEWAVGFDHEAVREADEVDHIGTYRDLAAELEVRQAAVAEQLPERPFGPGGAAAEGSRLIDRGGSAVRWIVS